MGVLVRCMSLRLDRHDQHASALRTHSLRFLNALSQLCPSSTSASATCLPSSESSVGAMMRMLGPRGRHSHHYAMLSHHVCCLRAGGRVKAAARHPPTWLCVSTSLQQLASQQLSPVHEYAAPHRRGPRGDTRLPCVISRRRAPGTQPFDFGASSRPSALCRRQLLLLWAPSRLPQSTDVADGPIWAAGRHIWCASSP